MRCPLSRSARRAISTLSIALLLALPLALAGCGAAQFGPVGELTLHRQTGADEPLASRFDHGIYSFGGDNTLTIVLLQGSIEQPQRAVTMRMFWQPTAGRTPIDREATNTTIHYIRFESDADGQPRVAVYSGAGFLYPRNTPGGATFHAGLWDATLRLTDTTDPATDPLAGPAAVRGSFSVRRDDAGVARMLRQLSVAVSHALTYPRLVRADTP
ncbi:MAG: hypothetical protein ACODAQ_12480 [Phycisphaeraceae bacterium]